MQAWVHTTRRVMVLGALLALTFPGRRTLAHTGPSARENNRYIKLTVLGDRVRLLYTYYVGEVPGGQARLRMDQDRDGVLSKDEGDRYASEVAQAIAGRVQISLDGAQPAIAWDSVDLGLGTDTVNAGSFSIDLVEWLCLEPGTASHRLVLFDHWKPEAAGETELRIEQSPGVDISAATLGADEPSSQLRAKWFGATPLDDRGLYVTFTATPSAAASTDGRCSRTGQRPAGGPWRSLILIALIAAPLVAAPILLRRKLPLTER